MLLHAFGRQLAESKFCVNVSIRFGRKKVLRIAIAVPPDLRAATIAADRHAAAFALTA